LQIAAGSDTTANVIRATLLLLCTAPHVYQRLQTEIDNGAASGAISSPITHAEARAALPYLQAIIYESMRYHPPAFTLLPKVVPPEGDTLPGGYFVPGGTMLATSNLGMMRHAPTFGEDVDVFRPERFMDARPERRLEMERTTELIFGIGGFMCAGKTVAFMELNKIFVEVSTPYIILIPCSRGRVQGMKEEVDDG
jgi:cytochrome P450